MSNSRRDGFTQLELLVTLSVIALLIALLLPAIQSTRESSRRAQCRDRLRGLGVAIHGYEAAHGRFPPIQPLSSSRVVNRQRRDGSNLWYAPHVLLLPHLDQRPLFDQFELTRQMNFTGRVPESLPQHAQTPLDTFLCPSDGLAFGNNYRVCTGSATRVFEGSGAFSDLRGYPASAFRDGLTNTVAASEALKSDSNPEAYSAADYWSSGAVALGRLTTDEVVTVCKSLSPPPQPGTFYSHVGHTWAVAGYDFTWYNHAVGPNANIPDCTTNSPQSLDKLNWNTSLAGVHKASSRHHGGVHVLYMDGSVTFVSDAVNLGVWRAVGTRDGTDPVSRPGM